MSIVAVMSKPLEFRDSFSVDGFQALLIVATLLVSISDPVSLLLLDSGNITDLFIKAHHLLVHPADLREAANRTFRTVGHSVAVKTCCQEILRGYLCKTDHYRYRLQCLFHFHPFI